MADESPTSVNDIVTDYAAKNAPAAGADTQNKNDTPSPSGAGDDKNKNLPPPPPIPDEIKTLLSDFNLETVEQLRERLKPKEEPIVESPEQKKKREDLYQVEMQRFSVEEGLMKPEEFAQLTTIRGKDDQTLVFESWLPSWKEENPDVKPEDADRQAREDFEAEYQLNSQNEKTKSRGLKKIEKEARGIRGPLETAYNNVKKQFDEDQGIKADFPDFNKKMTGLIQEHIPGKVKLFEGKGNTADEKAEVIPVEATLTDDQRKDIFAKVLKSLSNNGTYQAYKGKNDKALQEAVSREVDKVLWTDYRPVALQEIASSFHKKGFEKGQLGAKQPFPLIKDKTSGEGGGPMTAAEEVLNQPAFKPR